MSDIDMLTDMMHQAAREGKRPHEILDDLLIQLKERWPEHVPIVQMEHYFRQAFAIPLRDMRDVEGWNRLSEQGQATDHDIDRLFEPWIRRYLQQVTD